MADRVRLITRRTFLAGLTTAAGAFVAACGAAPGGGAGGAAARPTAQVVIAVPTPVGGVVSATSSAAVTGAIKRGGVLKVHRQNDWPTLDPHLSQASLLEAPLIFDYLTTIVRNPATGGFEVRPSLAESWEIPEPTTVVFKLRKGVKFHDGTDFNAEAARWNLERMQKHPKSQAKNQTAAIESMTVVDPATLRLKLKAPSPALFYNLSSDADSAPAMISPTHAEKVGDAGLNTQPVSTGPFRFVEWKPGDHVFYKRWDHYWKNGADGKPLPYFDEAQVFYQPDWSVAVVRLRTGDFDLVTNIGGKDVPGVKSNPALVYREAPWQATMYALCFNARPGARFAGENMKKVRQAAFYAIDRESMAKALGLGLGEPTGYHLVPGQLGYSDSVPRYTYDPAKAKQLLKEAGFADGLEMTLDFISRPEDLQNAQLYKQMLEAVGIRLTLQPQERVAWVQKTLAGNFHFASFQSGTRPDPDLVVGYRFAKGGPGNYAGWENPEMDRLLEEGRTTYDTTKRQAAYEKAQAIVFEDAYYSFSWRRSGNFAMTKALKGFVDPWSGPFANSTELWLDR